MFREETTAGIAQVPTQPDQYPHAMPVQSRNSRGSGVMPWFYAFFFVSGFCSILYELVWLRLSMAQFGVTTVLTATFLSVFMAGIGLGSWIAGRWLRREASGLTVRPIVLYAASELLIGVSAFLVPYELRFGHEILLRLGRDAAWTSSGYSCFSGIWLALSLAPWCVCMGATFPIAMSALRAAGGEDQHSFSYLYLANVLGAVAGATLPLLLIEQFGFLRTLWFGALLNATIATCAVSRSRSFDFRKEGAVPASAHTRKDGEFHHRGASTRWLLFATGLTSMGMEVVWIRIFTPYLGTVVYAFAAILGVYLLATFVGTKLYRRGVFGGQAADGGIWLLLGVSGLLPLIFADPKLAMPRLLRVAFGVIPLATAAGFATPMLVDRESRGDPSLAGSAYAINVLGCILGPLAAGFLLLPNMSERWALVTLSIPWLVIGSFRGVTEAGSGKKRGAWQKFPVAIAFLVAAGAIFFGKGFEGKFRDRRVLRDSTATVIATGSERSSKRLLVNGYGMSSLTPITKMMAHLPLAFASAPRNALVICFGMGTTHRSVLSWGIDSTVVELTPSVPRLFSYYHADGDQLLQSPRSTVIIDDGRRYLERSRETYDVITIDPPPPVEAAGSSLLYSQEFYKIARQRLSSRGILQQWLPGGDVVISSAVARALTESFPYVRAFGTFDRYGIHFLASRQPLPLVSGFELANRLPPSAVLDLLEWGPRTSAAEQFDLILRNEIPVERLIANSPLTSALTDDHPVNEYFLLRSWRR
jgi:predicted membrane-bound spermidine synthase